MLPFSNVREITLQSLVPYHTAYHNDHHNYNDYNNDPAPNDNDHNYDYEEAKHSPEDGHPKETRHHNNGTT